MLDALINILAYLSDPEYMSTINFSCGKRNTIFKISVACDCPVNVYFKTKS